MIITDFVDALTKSGHDVKNVRFAIDSSKCVKHNRGYNFVFRNIPITIKTIAYLKDKFAEWIVISDMPKDEVVDSYEPIETEEIHAIYSEEFDYISMKDILNLIESNVTNPDKAVIIILYGDLQNITHCLGLHANTYCMNINIDYEYNKKYKKYDMVVYGEIDGRMRKFSADHDWVFGSDYSSDACLSTIFTYYDNSNNMHVVARHVAGVAILQHKHDSYGEIIVFVSGDSREDSIDNLKDICDDGYNIVSSHFPNCGVLSVKDLKWAIINKGINQHIQTGVIIRYDDVDYGNMLTMRNAQFINNNSTGVDIYTQTYSGKRRLEARDDWRELLKTDRGSA